MVTRTITRIEVSGAFWRDLAKLRRTPDYYTIRRNIGEFVMRCARGEPGGDLGFKSHIWGDARHIHVGGKMILFNTYPDGDTLKLCALRKHDFYGYGTERKSQAGIAAGKVLNASVSPAIPSPGWKQLRWSDPGEIAGHPEFLELSRDGLDALYQEILEEGQTLARLERETAGLSERNAARIADGWLDSLIVAQEACERRLVAVARRRPNHLVPQQFTPWVCGPS